MRSLVSLGFIALTAILSITSCSNSYEKPPSEIVMDEKYIHRYGVEVPAEEWSAHGEHGQVVSTLKNGVIVTKNYKEGVLEGETTYSFPHNELVERVENYSKNIKTKEIVYYTSGSPKQEVTYQPQGKIVTTWYETGSPSGKETYDWKGKMVTAEYYNTNHLLDSRVDNGAGLRIMRDQYGQLLSNDTIQDGAMVLRTTHHQNGSPKEITPYQNGVVAGQKKSYLPGGEPESIQTWTNGAQNGLTVVFQNGDKFAEIAYVNNAKNGIERRYRNGSDLMEEITWRNDLLNGPYTTYVGNGSKIDWYYQGKPVTKANFDLLSKSVLDH